MKKPDYAGQAWDQLRYEYKFMLISGFAAGVALGLLAMTTNIQWINWVALPPIIAAYFAWFQWNKLTEHLKKGGLA